MHDIDRSLMPHPSSARSAEALLADREACAEGGVFPPGLIDAQAAMLRAYQDEDLSARLPGDAGAVAALVQEHLHCG